MNATTETTNAPPKTGRGIWKERPDSERGKWIKDRSERGLRKCASGNWAISFADQNGRVRSEVIGPSKAEARKVLEKRRTEVREKRYFPASAQRGGVTFDEVIEHAIKTARAEFEKKHPGKKFRPYRYKIVKTWFAGRKAHSVTPQEIQEKLNSHGGSLATWNHYRVTLSHAYKLAIMKGQADAQAQAPSPWTTITVNPAAQLQLQKPNNERVRFAEPEEEAALRAAILQLCPTREPEFDLALNTGMRWNEQYNLRRAQVDLKRSTITLLETKNGKRQYVRINAAARRALEQLLGSAPGSEFVCPDQDAWTHRRWWDAVR